MEYFYYAKIEKPITPAVAVGIVNNEIDVAEEEDFARAWQYLHDTGLAYQLEGWYGRRAKEFLDRGWIVDNK